MSDPNSHYNLILYWVDLSFSLLFGLECAFKIISRGFLFNGKTSYLKNGWNILDFVVITLSLASFIQISNHQVSKLLRTLRVVRPLRLIPKNRGLKTAVQSLLNSLVAIFNVTIMAIFIYFVWGIFGVSFFKGLYYTCEQSQLDPTQFLNMDNLVTKWDCINYGGEWLKLRNTFDNVFYAGFSLYIISTTQGWVKFML